MAAEVVFSREARSDLVSIYLWVEEAAGEAVAAAYQDRLRAACLALADFPGRGTPRPDLGVGVRSIAFERRAVIAYRENRGAVEILAVAHRGRDLGQEMA